MPGSCWDVGMEGGGGLTESCRSCRVFCASCLRLIGGTEINLIVFSGPRNCVNTQYAVLSGAIECVCVVTE